MNNRIKNIKKIMMSTLLYNIVNGIFSFIVRTVFINVLGNEYLGINGLFTNILNVLSFAELGVGTAITFCLYKPLSDGNETEIKALINFYKKAYQYVALVVLGVGIIILPFLKYIVNGVNIPNLNLIYLLFLANTVSSYFITYKTTILFADQKEYIIKNSSLVFKIVTYILQIVLLVKYRSFILYLVINFLLQLINKFYLCKKVNKLYPYLKNQNCKELDKETKNTIYIKIKALIIHKIGDISINQTDNIITSIFINTTTVGLVSNFVMIINMVNTFINGIISSATASFGNIIATESKENQYKKSRIYDFISFCLYGWSTLCLFFLLEPFIIMWIGKENLVDKITIFLLCLNFFLTGLRVALTNVKIAAGIYEQDKYVPLIQAISNIIISIVGAKIWGLKGVYIGTLFSSMFPNIIRPYIIYKYVFNKSVYEYYIEYISRILITLVTGFIIFGIFEKICFNFILVNILFRIIVISIIFIMVILIVFRNSNELKYFKNKLKIK